LGMSKKRDIIGNGPIKRSYYKRAGVETRPGFDSHHLFRVKFLPKKKKQQPNQPKNKKKKKKTQPPMLCPTNPFKSLGKKISWENLGTENDELEGIYVEKQKLRGDEGPREKRKR